MRRGRDGRARSLRRLRPCRGSVASGLRTRGCAYGAASPERRQVLACSAWSALAGGAALSRDRILDVDACVNRSASGARRAESSVRCGVARRQGAGGRVPPSFSRPRSRRIIVWSGAVLQKPHRALSAQRGIAPDGVFIAYFSYGSPATRYQLWAGRRIDEVDGQPIADLDAFVKAVSGREDRSSMRLRTVSWNGSVEVITLKLDQRFWPTLTSCDARTRDGRGQRSSNLSCSLHATARRTTRALLSFPYGHRTSPPAGDPGSCRSAARRRAGRVSHGNRLRPRCDAITGRVRNLSARNSPRRPVTCPRYPYLQRWVARCRRSEKARCFGRPLAVAKRARR